MIATFGEVSSTLFRWKRVATKDEGRAWLRKQYDALEPTTETAAAAQRSKLLSERNASRWRNPDGSRTFAPAPRGEGDEDAIYAHVLLGWKPTG